MAVHPREPSLMRTVAAWFAGSSLILAGSGAAAAPDPVTRIDAALAHYADGRAVSARHDMERLLAEPSAQDPQTRLAVLRGLLDVCIHSLADACVAAHAQDFVDTAEIAPTTNAVLKAELAREAAYYFDAGRLALHRPEVTAQILDWSPWKTENAYNGALYLRRQVLAANVLLAQDRPEAVAERIDRILSLVATLKTPEAGRSTVAHTLADALANLLEVGQTERAWGLYRASGADIARALPPRSVDAAIYRLTEAQLLQEVGDLRGARQVLETAIAILRATELDADVRDSLLAGALSLQAAVCAGLGDLDCAGAALRAHPAADRFARPGSVPAQPDEVAYLAARALVAALAGGADPAAAEALRGAAAMPADRRTAATLETYRLAGLALGLPPGASRQAALGALARRLRDVGQASSGWRPGALDQLLVALALAPAGGPDDADADATFALFQLAGRAAPTFDTDALAALSQAGDELQRRAIHQALRLRARRDRLEREQIQAVMARAVAQPAVNGVLSHEPAARLRLRDFARRLAAAERALPRDRGGSDVVTLRRFQEVLGPNEAALAVAPTAGGLAYMCVRRDRTLRRVGPADLARARLDGRLVQAALTAGHAPSERLDSQFPAEAASRLYDVLIRPFEGCLRPGDEIVWLAGVAGLDAPLAVLLPEAPPKREGGGYDLATARWLVRDHAVSYAGSAAVIVAARAGGGALPGDFDFLGVGDPVLAGGPQDAALLRGVRAGARFEGLAPLPETRDELEASARGFRTARLLMRDAATERGLRGQLVGGYSYLSFATHGLLREDLQGLSEPALVLTPTAADDPFDDGLLTASEIADLNLRARFVALSACNTANFDLDQMAQDLPALASAFAVAGVPATLGTLWPVDSETGKRVVAGLFARLRTQGGPGPSIALAEAQRAFLADPPGPAYLHPRFWAPFVVLGDGAAAPAPALGAERMALTSVEVLTTRGGEVLSVIRDRAGVAAQLISDADSAGRQGAAVRLARTDGAEAWRHDRRDLGATRLAVKLGSKLVVGGYREGRQGRFIPTLEAYGLDGNLRATWHGEGISAVDAFIFAGAQTDTVRAIFAVGELNLRDPPEAGGGRLHVFEVDAGLAPKALFDVIAPPGAKLSGATLTPMGDDLLVTYTDDSARPTERPPETWDDYDMVGCMSERVTWIELRDARTGALRGSKVVRGLSVVTAVGGRTGEILLGGAVRAACGDEGAATVVSVDKDLRTRTIYRDTSLGASDVRTLARLPDGRTFVAASKENVVNYRRAGPVDSRPNAFSSMPFEHTSSGLMLMLDRDGALTATAAIDSGSNVYVTAADASRPAEILLGGSLGGEAAIFHLAAPVR